MAEAARVTLRFFAAARAAAGRSERTVAGDGPLTINDCLALARTEANDYDDVMARCSFLVDSIAVTDRDRPLPEGATVDVLPPFAGG